MSSVLPLAKSLRLLTSFPPQLSTQLLHQRLKCVAITFRLLLCSLFLAKGLGDMAFVSAKSSVFVIELDKLLVFQDHGFGGTGQLFPESQELLLQALNIRRCFFAPLPLMPCPHGPLALVVSLIPFGQDSVLSDYPGVVLGVHLSPTINTAIFSKAVLALN